jgi:hypothetical protein
MKGRYEGELSCARQQHAEELDHVMADGRGRLEQVHREHAAALAHLQTDTFQREAELRHRLASVEEQYSGLKNQSRKIMDSMQKDKNTKLQVTAGRCKKLEDEVESLQTVLDLRHEELQELRKQNALLTREAEEELPVALHQVASLEAKVEDLKVQLQVKTNRERQLSEHNRLLMESVHQESKQSKRLLLRIEELQWKLKQTVESVTAMAALSGASMTDFLQVSSASVMRATHGSTQSLTDSNTTTASNEVFTPRPSPWPLPAGRSDNSGCSDLSVSPATVATAAGRSLLCEDLGTSPPVSPKVKGVVEKSDSVSWVVEIDESPEALLSRLVRRAGSFRGNAPSPSSSPSAARARTLPPPKRQRQKAFPVSLSSSATAIVRHSISSHSRNIPATASQRFRSHSVCTDSAEDMGLEYSSWSPETSTPVQNSPYIGMGNLHCEDDFIVHTNNNESCLNHFGNATYVNDDCDAFTQNMSSVIHNFSGVSSGASEYSNDGDSPSKSSGSSGSSDGSQKDHSRSCCHNRRQITDLSGASDSLDLGGPEVLPLPPLPGSTSGDLSLLTAQALPPPKESAGEAMISEETSEDDNDNADDMNSSSDEQSCSGEEEEEEEEEEDTTSSSGSLSDLRPVPSRGLTETEDADVRSGCQNLKQEEEEGEGRGGEMTSGEPRKLSTGSLQHYQVLLMSESATSTAMELSCSEDMHSKSDG